MGIAETFSRISNTIFNRELACSRVAEPLTPMEMAGVDTQGSRRVPIYDTSRSASSVS